MNNIIQTQVRLPMALSAALILSACGGGDGGSDSSSGAPITTASEPPVADVTAVQEQTRTMADLIVPDDFNYSTVASRSLSVDMSAYSAQTAYLSIYQQYSEAADGAFRPHPNSKVAQVALIAGVAELEITMDSAQHTLLAEVWYMDRNPPLQFEVTQQMVSLSY